MSDYRDVIRQANGYRRHMLKVEAEVGTDEACDRALEATAEHPAPFVSAAAQAFLQLSLRRALESGLIPREASEAEHLANFQSVIRFLVAVGYPDILDSLVAILAHPRTRDTRALVRMGMDAIAKATGDPS